MPAKVLFDDPDLRGSQDLTGAKAPDDDCKTDEMFGGWWTR